MLVIAALLTALPVATSHAMPERHMQDNMANHPGGHSSGMQAEKSEEDCHKHTAKSDVQPNHETGSCCEAFCATFAITEALTFSLPVFSLPSFGVYGSSAVLPGEFPTPHRPPSA